MLLHVMPSKKPQLPVRFESKEQMKRIRRAAALRKWSFNQFVVDAAGNAAERTLTTERRSSQEGIEGVGLQSN